MSGVGSNTPAREGESGRTPKLYLHRRIGPILQDSGGPTLSEPSLASAMPAPTLDALYRVYRHPPTGPCASISARAAQLQHRGRFDGGTDRTPIPWDVNFNTTCVNFKTVVEDLVVRYPAWDLHAPRGSRTALIPEALHDSTARAGPPTVRRASSSGRTRRPSPCPA
jgi:hypothetical protein